MFVTCIDGKAQLHTCPAGLVFDELKGVCSWPETAGRTGCVREEGTIQMRLVRTASNISYDVLTVLDDGFKCPAEPGVGPEGNPEAHPKYAHPEDCQKFYVCLNNITPREHGCELGEVYNAESQRCDLPENVPGW